MVEESQKRQIAVKTRIIDLLKGKYIKEAGWMPNYILTEKGEKVSRINLIGVIVTDPIIDISYRSILMDDGSGRISIRAFQENKMFDNLNLGDPVFIIGRPREYNGQFYVFPEIIKKIHNKKWIEVRKLELEQKTHEKVQIKDAQPESINVPKEEKVEIVEEKIEEGKKDTGNEQDISKKIYDIIKNLDKGDGVDYEEVITKSGSVDAEKIISLLLKEGEVFEVSPGKLKILE